MMDLVAISYPGLDDHGERVLKAAEWMGILTRRITVGDRPAIDHLAKELEGKQSSVVVSADALASLRALAPADALQHFLAGHCTKLLVYSVGGSPRYGDQFRWLTDGAVADLTPPEERQGFRFPASSRRIGGAFAGQSFTIKRAAAVSTFDLSNSGHGGIEQVLLADERPMFVRMEGGACELFLLSVDQLPDINERLSQSRGVEEHYHQLIPLLIFLRHCFGERCWHAAESTGRLIIDDPLLVQSYGFLSFAALRNSMRSTGYATSIAFIPWNYWRSSRKNAASIFGQDPNLSICVHGCDHTNREFDDLNPGSLQWKAGTALRRMERHESRTGLSFDPVMVFPQGKFTSAAVSALRKSGYLAAVNTTCFPTNAEAVPLTIADFLRPAMTRFSGFPLFQRRYPRRLIDSAFDIFLGRPVLLVQHHDDFREGYQALEAFVDGLHKIEPKLTWGPLAVQLMQSCLVRSPSEGSMEVRFFTGRFRFKNTRSTQTSLVFSKEEPDASAISSVLVDGQSVPFSFNNGLLTFEYQAKRGQIIDVTVLDRPKPPAPAPRRLGLTHTISVCARRALSELRDSQLAKHPRLLAAATGIAALMKVTGETGRQHRN